MPIPNFNEEEPPTEVFSQPPKPAELSPQPSQQLKPPSQKSGSLWKILFGLAVFIAIALGWLALSNYQTAETQKAETVKYNDLANEWETTANKNADLLRNAENKLAKSEEDVTSLTKRQKQLANEKANVEDRAAVLKVKSRALSKQRSVVLNIATELVQCQSNLKTLLDNRKISKKDRGQFMIPCNSANKKIKKHDKEYSN